MYIYSTYKIVNKLFDLSVKKDIGRECLAAAMGVNSLHGVRHDLLAYIPINFGDFVLPVHRYFAINFQRLVL